MRLMSVSEMKSLELTANAAGYSYDEMMQHAGTGLAQIIHSLYSHVDDILIIGLIGSGNNGGDTLVALTALMEKGWRSLAVLFSNRKATDPLLEKYMASGGKLLDLEKEDLHTLTNEKNGIILDGVFGTGFHIPMTNEDANKLRIVKQSNPTFKVIAVDCPSGVDCQTGEVSPDTLVADLTICFEAVKYGLLTVSAFPYCGKFKVVDLGLNNYSNDPVSHQDEVIGREIVSKLVPSRPDFSHKGTFGKVMVVGGSVNFPGAPILTGRGAYAVGVGLVQVAVPESVYRVAAALHPELTWLILEEAGGVISENAVDTLIHNTGYSQCIVLGPGIGREDTTARFLHDLLFRSNGSKRALTAGFLGIENGKIEREDISKNPVIIDADALTLLANEINWKQKLKLKAIMTPHPGEMAVLTGLSVEEIQANRIEICRRYAQEWGQVVVLKGALTIIGDENGHVAVIPVASSALAKAGSGDVLAGMIAGFVAQGLSCKDAAIAGAWIHAQAGCIAAKIIGANEAVLASDIIRSIAEVYQEMRAN